MPTVRIKTLYDPVYVTPEEAESYEDEEFVSGGFYIPAEVQYVEGNINGMDVGSEGTIHYGPYVTEYEALASIPHLAPGILVKIK